MKAFRKPISILLALLMIAGAFFVIPFSVAAEEETEVLSGATGDCTWTLEDGVLTISGNGRMEDYDFSYDIPWYSYRESIVEVKIENGVTRIGYYAFRDCAGLTSVTIPDSVTSIDYYSFSGCTGLIDVNLHIKDLESFCNGSYIKEFLGKKNYYLYMNGEPLNDIVVPDSITSLSSVFSYCKGISSFRIPKHLSKISTDAFYGCTNLTSITVDPENRNYDNRDNCNAIIDKKNNALMRGCKSTIIPDSVTRIDSYAFSGCTGLTSINIPDSVTSIGDNAFYGCTGLTSIDIPDSVTSIEWNAFKYCEGLTSINIPDSVTWIGEQAFSGCTGLTNIIISDSVSNIGDFAFSGCTGLKIVTLPQYGVDRFHSIFGTDNIIENVVLSCSVKSIGEYVFSDSTGLTSITIPNSVTSIGGNTFSGCTGLTNLTIPDSVTWIGERAFSGCTGLMNIEISDSVTSIEFETFYGCTGLTSITIGNSVSSIGNNAFYGCKRLTGVTIGNSVTSIRGNAFNGCVGMNSVTIPKSVTEIGDKAFGYYKEEEGNYKKLDGFTIYGYEGSAADDYAWNNIFDFVRITEDPTQPVTTEPTNPEADTTEVVTAEPTQPVTDNPTELNTETVEPEKPEFITYYYQPSQEQIDAGNKFVVSVTAKNGVTYSYVMSLCEKEIGGAPVYGADVPYGIEIDEMYFQVYDGETWTSQIAVSPETAEGAVVKYDGNIIDLNPENPAESKETQAYIDNPTAPQPTAPVVTDPQPTDVQPTGIAPTSPSVNPDNKKKNNPMKVTVKKKTVKLKKLKEKAQKVKAITVKNNKGKLSFKLVKKGITKKIRKLVKINSKGVITIKKWKKAKKGTYKIKVKITAKGNAQYNSKTVTKTVKVKVK